MTFGQMARNSWNKSCPCPPFQLSKMTPSVDGRSNATVFDKSVSFQQKSKKPKFKVGFKHYGHKYFFAMLGPRMMGSICGTVVEGSESHGFKYR